MVSCIHGENLKLIAFDHPKLYWIEIFLNRISQNLLMCVDRWFSQIRSRMCVVNK